jgi:hypothetical protein
MYYFRIVYQRKIILCDICQNIIWTYSRFAITRVIVLESSFLFLTEGMYTSGYITVNVTKRLKNWKNLCILIQIKSDLLELFYLAFYIARYRWILWDLYFYFISWMTVIINKFSVLYVAFSRKSALLLKLRTLIVMYGKFIPIFAVESFVLFYFKGDYLNLEMFKIFYYKDVYFCMIFSFLFFFSRDQCRFP